MPPERASNRDATRARTRPEFHQLAIFLKVVETRSFAATARQLGCTQPAISQAVARLEDLYGGDLFERRRGAPLALTPIGEAILPSARTLIDTVDEQMFRAVQIAQSQSGVLTVGFSPGLAAGWLRSGIAEFIEGRADVRLRLVEDASSALHRSLIERTLDLIVVAAMPKLADAALGQQRVRDERLFVAMPTDHALARHAELKWIDLIGLPVLLSNYDEIWWISRAWQNHPQRPAFQFERHAVSPDTLLNMVEVGMGVAIACASAIAPGRALAFRPIVDDNASLAIEAIWRMHDGNPLRHRLLRAIGDRQNDRPNLSVVSGPSPPTAPAPDRG